jgi:hypothetical protein
VLSSRLDVMAANQQEELVFDLLGKGKTTGEIAAALQIHRPEAALLVKRVVDERGTPNLAQASQAIAELADFRF